MIDVMNDFVYKSSYKSSLDDPSSISLIESNLDDSPSISLIESSLDDSPSISLIIVIVIVVEGGSDAIMNACSQARAGK